MSELERLRTQLEMFKAALLAYAPHKSTEERQLDFIKWCIKSDRQSSFGGDADTALLDRLVKAYEWEAANV